MEAKCRRCHQPFRPERANGRNCRRCLDECPTGRCNPLAPAVKPCQRCGKPVRNRQGVRFCPDCSQTDRDSKPTAYGELSAEDIEVIERWVNMGNAISPSLIAATLGLTRQGVDHITQRALRKLSHHALRLDLRDTLLHVDGSRGDNAST